MGKLIKNVSIYLISLLIFAISIEWYLTIQLKHGFRYYFQEDWHDLKNHNSEILFIGNSRTWVHINPFDIQKKFNLKSEILAVNGQGPHILWLKFKEYIRENKNPKEIYLQFDPFFIYDRNDLYGFKNYSTGFFLNRIDFSSLRKYNGYTLWLNYIPLLAIEHELLLKIIFNDTISDKESYEITHGFMKQKKKWEGNWNAPENGKIINKKLSSYIDSFAIYSKNNNVKLYAIYSPQSTSSYKKIPNTNLLKLKVDSLINKYKMQIEYLNFNYESLYNDSNLFYNHMHLNDKGVDVFMNHLLNNQNAFKSFR